MGQVGEIRASSAFLVSGKTTYRGIDLAPCRATSPNRPATSHVKWEGE